MFEQSKSARRRYYDGNFITRYFRGRGIDIGAGRDTVGQYKRQFPLISDVHAWDMLDGDAQYLEGVADATFDWAHASHCLEHMADPRIALRHWLRVVRPGGYLIITVPDEDMYEGLQWPSRWSNEHLWSFTICKTDSPLPKSLNVVDLVREFSAAAACERIMLVDDFHQPEEPGRDQTLTANAECAIELILRKK